MNARFPLKEKILVLEDDKSQFMLIKPYLENLFSTVFNAQSIEEFYTLLENNLFDMVLLDLNLPDGDGLDLLNLKDDISKLPVIIITSRNSIKDRVLGLESGAADYICKPYHPRELIARITNLFKEDCRTVLESKIRFNNTVYNTNTNSIMYNNEIEIKLTTGENIILNKLFKAEGMILSRDTLLNAIPTRGDYSIDRTIDVLISRIRKKLRIEIENKDLIESVKGCGYRIKISKYEVIKN